MKTQILTLEKGNKSFRIDTKALHEVLRKNDTLIIKVEKALRQLDKKSLVKIAHRNGIRRPQLLNKEQLARTIAIRTNYWSR